MISTLVEVERPLETGKVKDVTIYSSAIPIFRGGKLWMSSKAVEQIHDFAVKQKDDLIDTIEKS